MNTEQQKEICGECGSEFFVHMSRMHYICPECAHWIYDYDACAHQFEEGRCKLCYWDGSVSDNVATLKKSAD